MNVLSMAVSIELTRWDCRKGNCFRNSETSLQRSKETDQSLEGVPENSSRYPCHVHTEYGVRRTLRAQKPAALGLTYLQHHRVELSAVAAPATIFLIFRQPVERHPRIEPMLLARWTFPMQF